MRTAILAALAMIGAAPAWGQDYLTMFAAQERVYFAVTSTEQGMPPKLSIRVFIAIDPPTAGGIVARDMLVDIDCTVSTFAAKEVRSYDNSLKIVSSVPDVSPAAPVGGPMLSVRNYVCDGKIPSGATRYGDARAAYDAGVRILGANRANPGRP